MAKIRRRIGIIGTISKSTFLHPVYGSKDYPLTVSKQLKEDESVKINPDLIKERKIVPPDFNKDKQSKVDVNMLLL